jgi:hypothetical protein
VGLVKDFYVLENAHLKNAYLIIDALDECITDSVKLIELIVQKSASPRVKWIVSSRNLPDIHERLEMVGIRRDFPSS